MVDTGDRRAVLPAIRAVLAANCACAERDFVGEGVVVTRAEERPGRLRFPFPTMPLLAVTMGAGVVVSCHPERAAWLRANLGQHRRDAVFAAATIGQLARYIEPDGQYLAGPDLKYACSSGEFRPAAVPRGSEVTLVEGDAIAGLYRYRGFETALSYWPGGARPDVLATVATRGGEVVGIAGASADGETLWQIGVEVVAAARGGGIGRALVGRLTEGILGRGRIPYYSTAVSNIRSRAVALSLGYWPAWTELYARDR